MDDMPTAGEHYNCLVCRRIHQLQVTYDSQGNLLACAPIGPDVRVLPLPDQVLIVCVEHTGSEVAAALATHLSAAEADGHDHDHDHDED